MMSSLQQGKVTSRHDFLRSFHFIRATRRSSVSFLTGQLTSVWLNRGSSVIPRFHSDIAMTYFIGGGH